MSQPWISVVGLTEAGLDALEPSARALVDEAEVLIGGARHLAMVPDGHPAARATWKTPLADTIDEIRGLEGRRVCVLATGDPMSFGIGVTLASEFGADALTVIPAPGAFSLAAARLAWPLDRVDCLTLHGRPLDLLNLYLRPGARLLILSHDGGTPAQVAQRLRERGFGPSEITVLEHMGGTREARRAGTANGWDDSPCADLNTIAVACVATGAATSLSRAPGLPDSAFLHDGQLTKRVVRAATLAALAPQPRALLWDVGAGCGSVAIEWMRAGGDAIAVEAKVARVGMTGHNAAALGTPLLRIVHGRVPEALKDLPDPDAVFIGGGITADGLAETCWERLARGGRLVANAVTAEGEGRLFALNRRFGGEMSRIIVSNLDPVGAFHGWRPQMPVTQWMAVKK